MFAASCSARSHVLFPSSLHDLISQKRHVGYRKCWWNHGGTTLAVKRLRACFSNVGSVLGLPTQHSDKTVEGMVVYIFFKCVQCSGFLSAVHVVSKAQVEVNRTHIH